MFARRRETAPKIVLCVSDAAAAGVPGLPWLLWLCLLL